MTIDLLKVTKKELKEMPYFIPENVDTIRCISLLLLPSGKRHESGWGSITLIALKNREVVAKFNGYSDLLCLDGISGNGEWDSSIKSYKPLTSKSWELDLLPCGVFRLFTSGFYELKISALPLSCCEIFAVKGETNV